MGLCTKIAIIKGQNTIFKALDGKWVRNQIEIDASKSIYIYLHMIEYNFTQIHTCIYIFEGLCNIIFAKISERLNILTNSISALK